MARSDEAQDSFLGKRGSSKSETAKIVETESLLDFVITALARGKVHRDGRLELEGRAKRLLERA